MPQTNELHKITIGSYEKHRHRKQILPSRGIQILFDQRGISSPMDTLEGNLREWPRSLATQPHDAARNSCAFLCLCNLRIPEVARAWQQFQSWWGFSPSTRWSCCGSWTRIAVPTLAFWSARYTVAAPMIESRSAWLCTEREYIRTNIIHRTLAAPAIMCLR